MSPLAIVFSLAAGVVLVLSWGCSADDSDFGQSSTGSSAQEPQNDGSDDDPQLPMLGGDQSLEAGSVAPDGAPDTCVTLALWGSAGMSPWGPATQPDALAEWFTESTTATARSVQVQPESIEVSLEGVDALVLRDLRLWNFSEQDEESVAQWVQAGGALMALSGYVGDGTDARTTNSLLSFSQLRFSVGSDLDTALGIGPCGYCLGTTSQQGGFDAQHLIAKGVERVGAYQGRSIEGEGRLVASQDDLVLGMTKEVGSGRVFLFHDDWASQAQAWSEGASVDCSNNQECAEVSIGQTYQMHQFWYNVVRWLVPSADCFDVTTSGASVQRW